MPPQPSPSPLDSNDCIQDDDGYCEIDEIRLPAIIKMTPSAATTTTTVTATATTATPNPELKRQGTTNTDSIPEETEHEINCEKSSVHVDEFIKKRNTDDTSNDHDSSPNVTEDGSNAFSSKCAPDEAIELCTNDSITQPTSELNSCMSDAQGTAAVTANRLALTHGNATTSAPAIPCHLISVYVSALSLQISQLLVSSIGINIGQFNYIIRFLRSIAAKIE